MASQHCVYCGKHLSETAGTAVCGSPECSRRYSEDKRLAIENRHVRTWRPEDSQPLDIDQVLSQQADLIRRMREGRAAGREADDIAVTPVDEEPLAGAPLLQPRVRGRVPASRHTRVARGAPGPRARPVPRMRHPAPHDTEPPVLRRGVPRRSPPHRHARTARHGSQCVARTEGPGPQDQPQAREGL